MIAYISGKLVQKSPTQIVIETGGIGYEIRISVTTFRTLGDIGTLVRVLTYLHVREDLMQLFGFSSLAEKQLFLKLISISGIGPKLAQVILSGATVDEFTASVLSEDISGLTRIPGIGKKTAQRLVFDLKDKLTTSTRKSRDSEPLEGISTNSVAEEAILALVSLGYARPAAENAMRKVQVKHGTTLSLEDMIKTALKEI